MEKKERPTFDLPGNAQSFHMGFRQTRDVQLELLLILDEFLMSGEVVVKMGNQSLLITADMLPSVAGHNPLSLQVEVAPGEFRKANNLNGLFQAVQNLPSPPVAQQTVQNQLEQARQQDLEAKRSQKERDRVKALRNSLKTDPRAKHFSPQFVDPKSLPVTPGF